MAYLPPGGGRMNVTIGSNVAGVPALISTGTLALAGGNNITLSQNAANGITFHGAAGAGLSAGTQSAGTGTVNFANSNGITFGMSGSSQITASHNGITSQSNQVVSVYAGSNTFSSSSGTLNASSLRFVGSGNVSVGVVNGSVMVSGAGGGAGGGVALANSETTYTSGTVNFAGDGPVTVFSGANQSYRISIPGTSSLSATGAFSIITNGATVSMGAPAFSAGISTLGNTAGTSGTVSNQLVLAGGTNITLSQSTGAGGNTISIIGGGGGGAALSAAGSSVSTGTVVYSNSNNVSFGMNGSTITASASFSQSVQPQSAQTQSNIQAVYDGVNSISTGTIRYSNANGVSLGINGQTLTASHNGLTSQSNQALSGSNGSFAFQTATFGNLNGLSFYTSNGSMVGSHNAITSQSNQNISLYALGNTTQNSSTALNASNLSFNGLGGVSVGYSNGSIQISGGAGGAGGGVALANAETTYTSGTVNFAGDGAVTVYSGANQSYRISIPATSSLSATGAFSITNNGGTISMGVPAFSAGMSSSTYGGATGGTSGTISNQFVLAAGSNITLSQSTGVGGNTLAIYGAGGGAQTNQTLGIYATGANTTGQSSSNTLDARSFSISAQGGLYAGMSGNTLQLSAATTYAASNHSHGNPTLNLSNLSGATASASNGLTLSLSAASQSAQTQSVIQGVIASGSTNRTGDISFANSNGVTFGLSNNTVTASISAAAGGVALSANNLISSGTASLAAGGALTITGNGQSLSFNAPAVSSLVGAGGVTLSTNGSTISISGAAAPVGSYFDNMIPQNSVQALTYTSVSSGIFNHVILQPLTPSNELFPFDMTVSTMLFNFSNAGTSTMSAAHSSTWYVGLYTRVNSTQLSMINSASVSYGMSANANNSVSYNGARWLSIHSSLFSASPALSNGVRYFFGFMARTSGASYGSISMAGMHLGQSVQRSGMMAAAVNSATSLNAWHPFMGVHSLTTHTVMPATIGNGDINKASVYANFIPQVVFDAGLGVIQ